MTVAAPVILQVHLISGYSVKKMPSLLDNFTGQIEFSASLHSFHTSWTKQKNLESQQLRASHLLPLLQITSQGASL